jgi:hypothetical protein
MATGFLVLSTLEPGSSYWRFLAGLLPFGAGMALAGAPATNAIVSSLPRAQQGVASAVNDVSRELGGALGIAVLGSVLNGAYRSGLAESTDGLSPTVADRATASLAARTAGRCAPRLSGARSSCSTPRRHSSTGSPAADRGLPSRCWSARRSSPSALPGAPSRRRTRMPSRPPTPSRPRRPSAGARSCA